MQQTTGSYETKWLVEGKRLAVGWCQHSRLRATTLVGGKIVFVRVWRLLVAWYRNGAKHHV